MNIILSIVEHSQGYCLRKHQIQQLTYILDSISKKKGRLQSEMKTF